MNHLKNVIKDMEKKENHELRLQREVSNQSLAFAVFQVERLAFLLVVLECFFVLVHVSFAFLPCQIWPGILFSPLWHTDFKLLLILKYQYVHQM